MKRKFRMVCLGLLPLLCLPLLAVDPRFWTTSSFTDFSKGTLGGLSLRQDGTLALAPQFDSVLDSDQALIWSAVYDGSRHLYVATGHDGKVFRIDESAKSSLFFDSAELDVLALALDAEHNLYAATSPNGKVYKVSPQGEASVFFDPDDRFIWDLAFGPDGVLYVATGSRGKVYKVSPEGEAGELYDTGQTNVISLAVDPENHLLAGSDPKGYVYRIAPDGKAFVLFDTGMNEVHDIQVNAEGEVYLIAVNGGPGRPPPAGGEPATSVTATQAVTVALSLANVVKADTVAGPVPAAAVASPTAPGRGKLKSRLHRIGRDRSVETLWSSNSETAYGLYLDKRGNILFSSGDKGKIYSLSPKRELTLLIETTEEQTTRLIPAGDGLVACTSNLARIFRLRDRLNSRGSFESEVQDSTVVSRWGNVNWQAKVPKGASLKLYTRSGNTRRPDRTWSDWSRPYTRADGEKVESPPARYIQYKAVLETANQASPELSRVVIPYLQQNLAPEVKSIRILPQGVAFLKTEALSSNPHPVSPADREAADISGAAKAIPEPISASVRPRRTFQRGSRSFTWNASDPNGDKLAFTLHYRGEGESNWKPLVRDHSRRDFTLQSGALPDGSYRLKIMASDSPSNPASNARSGELVSAPFIVDNTPPAVEILSRSLRDGVAVVRFRVEDRFSGLRRADVSTDGGEWQAVYSTDGIIDSRTEEFRVTSEALEKGEHVVALRVYDAAGNLGLGKAAIQVP